jgi:hypothetical protein
MRPRGVLVRAGAVFAFACAVAGTPPARADVAAPAAPASARPVLGRAVVRFYAPETGGAARPRFIDERTLAFEARLEAFAERGDESGDHVHYQERHVRAALEHHVGEELLASLGAKLLAGLPDSRRPSDAELQRVEDDLGTALFERLGGTARVEQAAAAEQLDRSDIDALLHRQALAAWYLDRAVSPILQPTEEQLREVFRTSAHPYRGLPFDDVRADLARWFVVERLRTAESAFYQGARTRVTVLLTR